MPERSADAGSPLARDAILASALLNALGWILSLAQLLRPVPYAVGLLGAAGCFVWIRKSWGFSRTRKWPIKLCRIRRRLRRPIFVIYLVVWLCALIGGAIYAPSNYDALSYRIPQLLHWAAEGGWHWIDAANSRINIAPPGMNWLIAPFYFLTKSDRLWFVINLAAFSFLPGWLFELFRRAGASPRIAWWFMWIVPCGYAFALQAGSLGNDLLGSAYVAAAFAAAFRARTSHRVTDLWLSAAAMALATGVKSTNLPLLFPWFFAVWPALRLIAKQPIGSAAMVSVLALSSCLPTALLNIRETGSWTGDPMDEHRVHQPDAGTGIVSNAVLLTVANLQPPLFPSPSSWNQKVAGWLKQSPFNSWCQAAPRFDARWGELPTEEMASVGPGILAVSILCLVAAGRRRKSRSGLHPDAAWGVALAAWLAFLFFLARFSSEAVGRLSVSFAPILLVPILLFVRSYDPFRGKWMRRSALICASFCLPGLLLSPARPLFPVELLIEAVGNGHFSRIAAVYSAYSHRSDCYRPLLKDFGSMRPVELWFAGGADDPEAPAWKPFGSRSIRQLTALELLPHEVTGSPERIVLASELGIRERFGLSVEDFVHTTGAAELARADLNVRASRGAERWYVFHLPAAPR